MTDRADAARAPGDRQRFHDAAARTPRGGPRGRLWEFLIGLAAQDLPIARLVEAHADAGQIMAELGTDLAAPERYWAVWAAEAPGGAVHATPEGGRWSLSGTKRWCSGANLCTHALITAHGPDGLRLFAVRLADPGVRVADSEWASAGMRRADTTSVTLSEVDGVPVGEPDAYLDRPGFWHGAAGVAACWFGGAVAVSVPLRAAGGRGKLDEHGLAHLGAVDSALHAARCVLVAAAEEIDRGVRDGHDAGTADAKTTALRTRAVVEHAVSSAIDRVGRALGPGPLAQDAGHAQRVADLAVYVRQSHAERDLAELGRTVLGRDEQG